MPMPMMYGWNGDWGGMLLAMAVNAAVWIVVIGLLIWGVSNLLISTLGTKPSIRIGGNRRG